MTVVNKRNVAQQIISREQIRSRLNFLECAEYAEKAMSDEQLRIAYELFCLPGKSPYYMAFDDARNAPVITNIDASGYKGRKGNKIVIEAEDDFEIDKVHVNCFDVKGSLIEQNEAYYEANIKAWVFVVERIKFNITGVRIQVDVYDIPGNKTTLIKIID